MIIKIKIPDAKASRVINRLCEKYGWEYQAWSIKPNDNGTLPEAATAQETTSRLDFAKEQIRKFIMSDIKEIEVKVATATIKATTESAIDDQIKLTVESE